MASTSNLTLGTGYIDARTGTLYSDTLTTGAAADAGVLTGNWTLSASSQIDATAGTLRSINLTTGAAGTAGTLTGNWSMATTSNLTLGTGYIDARTGTLYSDTLNAGASGAAGVITGTWTVAAGSTLSANAVVGQANSATITATSANTANQIVLRDASGNFSAGTITAALTGNASTATTWATARTITLGGDLTGSVSINGSADVTLTATVTGNSVALGTDTTGDYVATVAVSGNGLSRTGTGESAAVTITSNATSANTANTIVFRDGSGNFSAGVMTGTATQARYADLAERYASDKEYEIGTVVVFGGEREITATTIKEDTRVAGVISEKPAYLMNHEAGDDKTHPAVALVGRVPCKVVGRIRKGDMLVTSGIKGVAVSSNNPKVGSMIGRALEDYDSDHIGVIEIAVGRG
jgi:hypothetical protein